MSPDSDQSRIARLEQQAQDLASSVGALAPFLRDQAVLADRYTRLQTDVDKLASNQRDLEARLDRAREDRERERLEQAQREQERQERERKDRFIRITTLVSLLLVFVSTSAGVIALVLN